MLQEDNKITLHTGCGMDYRVGFNDVSMAKIDPKDKATVIIQPKEGTSLHKFSGGNVLLVENDDAAKIFLEEMALQHS